MILSCLTTSHHYRGDGSRCRYDTRATITNHITTTMAIFSVMSRYAVSTQNGQYLMANIFEWPTYFPLDLSFQRSSRTCPPNQQDTRRVFLLQGFLRSTTNLQRGPVSRFSTYFSPSPSSPCSSPLSQVWCSCLYLLPRPRGS
jgi:hypothetical protein